MGARGAEQQEGVGVAGGAALEGPCPTVRVSCMRIWPATSFSFLHLPPLLLRHSKAQVLDMVSHLGI